jgi:hypothetical protein
MRKKAENELEAENLVKNLHQGLQSCETRKAENKNLEKTGATDTWTNFLEHHKI